MVLADRVPVKRFQGRLLDLEMGYQVLQEVNLLLLVLEQTLRSRNLAGVRPLPYPRAVLCFDISRQGHFKAASCF